MNLLVFLGNMWKKKMEVDLRRYITIPLKTDFLGHLSALQLVIKQESRGRLSSIYPVRMI